MSVTVRKDNAGDAVDVNMTIHGTILVGSSYTTTTTRTDAGQAPVDHVQVIATTEKVFV